MTAVWDFESQLSAQLVLEQAVLQMALGCSLGVANHELFPPAAKVLQIMTAPLDCRVRRAN